MDMSGKRKIEIKIRLRCIELTQVVFSVLFTKVIFPSFVLSLQRRGLVLVKLTDDVEQVAVKLLL